MLVKMLKSVGGAKEGDVVRFEDAAEALALIKDGNAELHPKKEEVKQEVAP